MFRSSVLPSYWFINVTICVNWLPFTTCSRSVKMFWIPLCTAWYWRWKACDVQCVDQERVRPDRWFSRFALVLWVNWVPFPVLATGRASNRQLSPDGFPLGNPALTGLTAEKKFLVHQKWMHTANSADCMHVQYRLPVVSVADSTCRLVLAQAGCGRSGPVQAWRYSPPMSPQQSAAVVNLCIGDYTI